MQGEGSSGSSYYRVEIGWGGAKAVGVKLWWAAAIKTRGASVGQGFRRGGGEAAVPTH
jgi:hypothetical protein